MKTKQVHEVIKVITWIIFVGLCIEAGAKLFSLLASVTISHDVPRNFYMGLDLSALYDYSIWHYVTMGILLVAFPALKAYLFFWVIKITTNLNIMMPFSDYNADLIMKMCYVSLQIGILGVITNIYADWLIESMVKIPYESQGAEYLFMAGVLFVIGQIFKRGIELQKENELTI